MVNNNTVTYYYFLILYYQGYHHKLKKNDNYDINKLYVVIYVTQKKYVKKIYIKMSNVIHIIF